MVLPKEYWLHLAFASMCLGLASVSFAVPVADVSVAAQSFPYTHRQLELSSEERLRLFWKNHDGSEAIDSGTSEDRMKIVGSSAGSGLSCKSLSEAGGKYDRVYLHWKYVQRTVNVSNLAINTVDYVKKNPHVIDEWANSSEVNWKDHDNRMAAALEANLTVIGEVGEGTLDGLPILMSDTSKVFDPHNVGVDVYLGNMYLVVRAIVRRYGQHIQLYQLENELNAAWLAGMGGQREFHVNSPWRSFQFLTKLLATLKDAVLAERSDAVVTQNLHTDLSEASYSKALLKSCYHINAARAWNDIIDIWSIDGYPNFFGAWPFHAKEMGQRVADMITNFPKKQVFVMETGYPVLAHADASTPDIANYTEERQAAWFLEAYKSVRDAGAVGFIAFEWTEQPGMQAPPGGWTVSDAKAVKMLADEYDQQDLFKMLGWLAVHIKEDHRLADLVSYRQVWGVLRQDGSERDAATVLSKCFNRSQDCT